MKRSCSVLACMVVMVMLLSVWYKMNESNPLEAWDGLLDDNGQIHTKVSLLITLLSNCEGKINNITFDMGNIKRWLCRCAG